MLRAFALPQQYRMTKQMPYQTKQMPHQLKPDTNEFEL